MKAIEQPKITGNSRKGAEIIPPITLFIQKAPASDDLRHLPPFRMIANQGALTRAVCLGWSYLPCARERLGNIKL